MNTSQTDSIIKELTLQAPRSRVWRAISDSAEFGAWFKLDVKGPFRVGEVTHALTTHPECSGLICDVLVEAMEPESYLALRWHPYEVEEGPEKWSQTTTLVEFRLEDAGSGTHLTLTESGFDQLTEEQREGSFTRNDAGWTEQMQNIKAYCDG